MVYLGRSASVHAHVARMKAIVRNCLIERSFPWVVTNTSCAQDRARLFCFSTGSRREWPAPIRCVGGQTASPCSLNGTGLTLRTHGMRGSIRTSRWLQCCSEGLAQDHLRTPGASVGAATIGEASGGVRQTYRCWGAHSAAPHNAMYRPRFLFLNFILPSTSHSLGSGSCQPLSLPTNPESAKI